MIKLTEKPKSDGRIETWWGLVIYYAFLISSPFFAILCVSSGQRYFFLVPPTLAANGSPSWTEASQIQLFVILYVLGIALAAAFGVSMADGIGRRMMARRFGKKVEKQPAVAILSDYDDVYVIFADGRIERISEDEIRDKQEISTSFESIVNVSRQLSKNRILLLSEYGDVFTSTLE